MPSDKTLSEYSLIGVSFGEPKLQPGILHNNINISSKSMPDVSHVVMFDGKKITPDSADIYLLYKEEEPKLNKVQ